MGMGVLDRYRRIAGALALVGTLFYSALTPSMWFRKRPRRFLAN